MVGMGSLVTTSVPDFHLVLGHPARSVGCVCRCGQLLFRFASDPAKDTRDVTCSTCNLAYSVSCGEVRELNPPT
jgi:UDP-2-acetamido-3-amino-2,3-dideoxy-glucuronate N-acetyltransferase